MGMTRNKYGNTPLITKRGKTGSNPRQGAVGTVASPFWELPTAAEIVSVRGASPEESETEPFPNEG